MLKEYLRSDRILIIHEARTFDAVVKDLCTVMAPALKVEEAAQCSVDSLFKAVQQREQAASTAVGFGCAIPHAALPGLVDTAVGMALLKKPLAMRTPDSEKVDIVFLMVGPTAEARTHLKLLSRIARILHNEAVRKSIRSCESSEQILEVLDGQDTD